MSKRVKNRRRRNVRRVYAERSRLKGYSYLINIMVPGFKPLNKRELEQLHRRVYPIRKELRAQEKRRREGMNVARSSSMKFG